MEILKRQNRSYESLSCAKQSNIPSDRETQAIMEKLNLLRKWNAPQGKEKRTSFLEEKKTSYLNQDNVQKKRSYSYQAIQDVTQEQNKSLKDSWGNLKKEFNEQQNKFYNYENSCIKKIQIGKMVRSVSQGMSVVDTLYEKLQLEKQQKNETKELRFHSFYTKYRQEQDKQKDETQITPKQNNEHFSKLQQYTINKSECQQQLKQKNIQFFKSQQQSANKTEQQTENLSAFDKKLQELGFNTFFKDVKKKIVSETKIDLQKYPQLDLLPKFNLLIKENQITQEQKSTQNIDTKINQLFNLNKLEDKQDKIQRSHQKPNTFIDNLFLNFDSQKNKQRVNLVYRLQAENVKDSIQKTSAQKSIQRSESDSRLIKRQNFETIVSTYTFNKSALIHEANFLNDNLLKYKSKISENSTQPSFIQKKHNCIFDDLQLKVQSQSKTKLRFLKLVA